MNILFLHPNFPAQFLYLAQHFVRMGGNRVVFLTTKTNGNKLPGVTTALYKTEKGVKKQHPYLQPIEEAVLDGQAVYRALIGLREKIQFVPDVIVGHTGWGSTLYCKDLYPDVPLVGYFEWYYHAEGSDVAYFPGEKVSDDSRLRIRTRNAHHLMNLEVCDVLFTPTEWQRAQFPLPYRLKMHVIHEGVDTQFCHPEPGKRLVIGKTKEHEACDLSGAKEILTYVSRGFEPYRGFPQFMQAAAILLKRRPNLHVVCVGSDVSCYGPAPEPGKTWRDVMDSRLEYDKNRVHFLGHLDRLSYQTVLQASTVHVYLTRPFILSWSMLEAMSFGCAVVGSKTPPVEEVIRDGENGLLANFRSPEHIAQRVEELLDDKALRTRLGRAARETILDRYDERKCVLRQSDMIFNAMK